PPAGSPPGGHLKPPARPLGAPPFPAPGPAATLRPRSPRPRGAAMSGWNFADVWEVVATQVPDAPALVHAGRRISWAEVDRRANGAAAAMLAAGAAEQDKVAQYLFNAPEYIESMYAAFKAGLVPINTNYRYQDDELVYLWDNAAAGAVVFPGPSTDTTRATPT